MKCNIIDNSRYLSDEIKMDSIDQWRWITLYEYLQSTPFELPEATLERFPPGESNEYEINEQVTIRKEGLHWVIRQEIVDEITKGTIIHKEKITEEHLTKFREEQCKMFTPAFTPIIDRVFNTLEKMYLNRTVYCVHLTELYEDGSDLFYTLPWPFSKEFVDSICPQHGNPELRFIHYTCHLLCI